MIMHRSSFTVDRYRLFVSRHHTRENFSGQRPERRSAHRSAAIQRRRDQVCRAWSHHHRGRQHVAGQRSVGRRRQPDRQSAGCLMTKTTAPVFFRSAKRSAWPITTQTSMRSRSTRRSSIQRDRCRFGWLGAVSQERLSSRRPRDPFDRSGRRRAHHHRCQRWSVHLRWNRNRNLCSHDRHGSYRSARFWGAWRRHRPTGPRHRRGR